MPYARIPPAVNAGFVRANPPRRGPVNAGFRRVPPRSRNAGFVQVHPPPRNAGFVQIHPQLPRGVGVGPGLRVPNYTVPNLQGVPDMSSVEAALAQLMTQRYAPPVQAVPDMSGIDALIAQALAARRAPPGIHAY